MRFYSDDPVRDAAMHDAYQDREYVPICERCGNPIEGNIYEVVFYGLVCEECEKYFADDEE